MQNNILVFHGIKFHNYSYSKILFKLNQIRGGYLVAPAASSLSKIYKNKFHHSALKKSTVAILDSGLFSNFSAISSLVIFLVVPPAFKYKT